MAILKYVSSRFFISAESLRIESAKLWIADSVSQAWCSRFTVDQVLLQFGWRRRRLRIAKVFANFLYGLKLYLQGAQLFLSILVLRYFFRQSIHSVPFIVESLLSVRSTLIM